MPLRWYNFFKVDLIKIYNPTAPTLQYIGGSAYSFPLTWRNIQNNIMIHSYGLMGFSMSISNTLLSFQAYLSNINSVGGAFLFYPKQTSTIINVQFSIILIENCRGRIEVQYKCKSNINV